MTDDKFDEMQREARKAVQREMEYFINRYSSVAPNQEEIALWLHGIYLDGYIAGMKMGME